MAKRRNPAMRQRDQESALVTEVIWARKYTAKGYSFLVATVDAPEHDCPHCIAKACIQRVYQHGPDCEPVLVHETTKGELN